MLWRTPELDSSSDDITMHHDKKVGLGLGILLVGIVGAFFFREEPRTPEPLPELQSAEILDSEITHSLVDSPQPYNALEKYEQRYKPAVNLEGIETSRLDNSNAGVPASGRKVFDEEFEFLNEPGESMAGQPKTAPQSPVSGLASNHEKQNPSSEKESAQGKNVAVTRTTSPGKLPSRKGMFTADLSSSTDAAAQPFADDGQLPAGEIDRASAGSLKMEATEPGFYIVQKGDTLSSIASQLLGRPSDYRMIFELNRDQLSSPDDLRPGMRLKVPPRRQHGKPTEVSLTREQQAPSSPRASQQNLERDHPQPKRDRRVIVPRRVRLNEPIAKNPERNLRNQPHVRFKINQPETHSNDDLPTLEGLEPLDLPR